MNKVLNLSVCIAVMFSSPAFSQGSDSDIQKQMETYRPGILLSPSERAALSEKDYSKDSPLPSSKYLDNNLSEAELKELYQDKSYKDAVLGILSLARTGNDWAQETIGLMYRFSQGVEKDDKLAMHWLLQAAKQQRPLAQHHLGFMYYAGEGDYKDYLKSAMFLELAHRNYSSEAEKNRAQQDRDNVMVRLSKIERSRVMEMADKFISDNSESEAQE